MHVCDENRSYVMRPKQAITGIPQSINNSSVKYKQRSSVTLGHTLQTQNNHLKARNLMTDLKLEKRFL